MEPTSFDILTKALVAESAPDIVTWLSGTQPDAVTVVPTELVRTGVSLSDQILRAEMPHGRAGEPADVRFFHVEIQTAGDPEMGLRMTQYWVNAVRYFSRMENRPVTISSTVIYLDRCQYRGDEAEYRADDGAGTQCWFRYRVVRLWEVDADAFLRQTGPGLAPFAPLMRTQDPIRTVVQSKQKILEAGKAAEAPEALPDGRQADLCGALFALAGLVIEDRDLLFKLLWEDWMGLERSVTVQWLLDRGMERGIERGAQRGLLDGRRDAVMDVLHARFGEVGESVARKVRAIEDAARLRSLVQDAARVTSIEEFAAALE